MGFAAFAIIWCLGLGVRCIWKEHQNVVLLIDAAIVKLYAAFQGGTGSKPDRFGMASERILGIVLFKFFKRKLNPLHFIRGSFIGLFSVATKF